MFGVFSTPFRFRTGAVVVNSWLAICRSRFSSVNVSTLFCLCRPAKCTNEGLASTINGMPVDFKVLHEKSSTGKETR